MSTNKYSRQILNCGQLLEIPFLQEEGCDGSLVQHQVMRRYSKGLGNFCQIGLLNPFSSFRVFDRPLIESYFFCQLRLSPFLGSTQALDLLAIWLNRDFEHALTLLAIHMRIALDDNSSAPRHNTLIATVLSKLGYL